MKDDEEALDLLRRMGRVVVPLLTPEREASRHEQMASAVNRLIAGLPPRPRRWPNVRGRVSWGIGATAAAIALFLAARHWGQAPQASVESQVARVISTSGESTLLRVDSPPRPLLARQAIEATDELRSAKGSAAELALTGTGKARVEVSEDTRVRFNQRFAGSDSGREDWLDLEQGLVTLQVGKLPPGLGLSVQTPNARVTVHGTRFSVRVRLRQPTGPVTDVSVIEGRVQVECRGSRSFFGPGEHWSSQDSEPGSAPVADLGASGQSPPEPSTEVVGGGAGAPGKTLERRTSAASQGANGSTLAEENRLYAQAMARASAGDLPQALARLAILVRSYPHSPLAQSARVDRFRLLQQSGNAGAAAQEARRYLSEYPNGFARAEARRLALLGLEKSE